MHIARIRPNVVELFCRAFLRMKITLLLVFALIQALFSVGVPLVQDTTVAASQLPWLWGQETPFPDWLREFTGLSEWPGMDPPYIPMDFIDMGQVPAFAPYSQDVCQQVPREACSFDCHACLAHDDINTCPKLSQTFDDGPSDFTDDLLDQLSHKSTFFTVGVNVVKHPATYQRLIEKGHLIGTHTWSHPYLPQLSNEQIVAQLQWSIWAMNATGGHYPKYFRPPYGGIDNRVRAIARMFGLQAVLWDHDTFDWELNLPGTSKSIAGILLKVSQWKNSGRGLILEHDAFPQTIEAGIQVSRLIGNDQLTVAQCVNGIDYIQHSG